MTDVVPVDGVLWFVLVVLPATPVSCPAVHPWHVPRGVSPCEYCFGLFGRVMLWAHACSAAACRSAPVPLRFVLCCGEGLRVTLNVILSYPILSYPALLLHDVPVSDLLALRSRYRTLR
jgi:hypothetical protein